MTAETLSLPVLLVHFAATFYMVGLVWFVQRVHYPLYASVGSQQFPAYEGAHVSRTSPVVGRSNQTSESKVTDALTVVNVGMSSPMNTRPLPIDAICE